MKTCSGDIWKRKKLTLINLVKSVQLVEKYRSEVHIKDLNQSKLEILFYEKKI